MTSRRYRAPTGDGELLAEPPLATVGPMLDAARSFGASHDDIHDLRRRARAEVARLLGLDLPDSVPLVVGGHQPEFFHPGVWIKNFAIAALAQRHGGIAIDLIVDNDVPKSAAIRIPIWKPGIEPGDVRLAELEVDRPPPADVPFEEWSWSNSELRDSLPDRLREATRDWPVEPIGLPEWAPGANVGESVVAARRAVERSWGLRNHELTVSRLSELASFRAFAGLLMGRAAEFRMAHNAALDEYRTRNRIRSKHHPVSELAETSDSIESPFWTWSKADPRRRRLMVDRARPPATSSAILRPRALTLTLFVRMFLADVFVHGIGGGKYDELTDQIAERFFGVTPPDYLVVSGTLRIPFPRLPGVCLKAARRRSRDLRWNPHRFVRESPLTGERLQWLSAPTATRADRRQRTRALRANLVELQQMVQPEREAADIELARAVRAEAGNAILRSREFAWPLYPAQVLRDWLTGVSGMLRSP